MKGLCHMAEGFFQRLEANFLDCIPEDASLNLGNKGNEVSLFEGLGQILHIRVDPAFLRVTCPIVPRSTASLVVHCCSPNRCPHSVEIMLDQRLEGGRTLCQGSFCGKGYSKLNWVRNVCGHIPLGNSSRR